MQIILRYSNRQIPFEVSEEQTVAEVKQVIAAQQNIESANSIRLVYSGKVLKDQQTIKEINIVENSQLYMVVSKAKAQPQSPVPQPAPSPQPAPVPQPAPSPQPAPVSQPAPSPQTDSSQQTFPQQGGFNNFGGSPGFNNFSGPPDYPSLIPGLDRFANLTGGPEMMQLLMNNPEVASNFQSIMSDPDLVNQLMSGQVDPSVLMNHPSFQNIQNILATNPNLISAAQNVITQNPGYANRLLHVFPQQFQQQQQQQQFQRQQQQQQFQSPQQPQQFQQQQFQQPQQPQQFQQDNSFDFNSVLLLKMLEVGSLTPEVSQFLKNSEVQAGLNQIAAGILKCRKAGLKIYESVPGIDQLHVDPVPAGPNQLTPEQRFGKQLEVLEGMQFLDREKNIAALSASNGNIERAIDYILTH